MNEKDDEGKVDFETSLEQVEQILARLESGELGLTESLEQYETGIKQLKRCHALLDAAEQRVSVLSGFDADGNPLQEPMHDLGAVTARDQTSARSQQTSSATAQIQEASDEALDSGEGSLDSVDDFPGLF